jgi:hypothetical protein
MSLKNPQQGYNFAIYLTSIGGLHKKLWVSKVARVPHLGVAPMVNHKKYYKGEGGEYLIVRGQHSLQIIGNKDVNT